MYGSMAAAKHDDEDVADDVVDVDEDDGDNDADDNDMCVPGNLDPGVPLRQSFS